MIPRVLALFVLCTLFGCPAKAPERATVSLRMTGSPPDARVTVDDELVGTLDVVTVRGVALPPGRHTVSVERAGFLPCDKLVEAKLGSGPVKVECVLVAVPE